MAEQKTKNLINGIDTKALGETVEVLRQQPELGESKFHIKKNGWVRLIIKPPSRVSTVPGRR